MTDCCPQPIPRRHYYKALRDLDPSVSKDDVSQYEPLFRELDAFSREMDEELLEYARAQLMANQTKDLLSADANALKRSEDIAVYPHINRFAESRVLQLRFAFLQYVSKGVKSLVEKFDLALVNRSWSFTHLVKKVHTTVTPLYPMCFSRLFSLSLSVSISPHA